jgi:hypothetical protein
MIYLESLESPYNSGTIKTVSGVPAGFRNAGAKLDEYLAGHISGFSGSLRQD